MLQRSYSFNYGIKLRFGAILPQIDRCRALKNREIFCTFKPIYYCFSSFSMDFIVAVAVVAVVSVTLLSFNKNDA